ncbi:hypothetical protein [Hymenobacter cellulosilyticus]|uniref:Uncharacterized protein n=1 Tax=Hymenobacter cellulosilyticus TaxID=2932248 RepID=A0A8T9Q986_9BACT|nr:hypothetical protein [Hymenobacter cellulosilyticus]UOQ72370.1 hypothetical protein MUN79_28165 [Hymenobacter cellulosilyticus]
MAANTAIVHKAALAAVNEYTKAGWHVISSTPNVVTSTGNTVFSQTVYVLEK